MMKLVVDARETKLRSALEALEMPFETRQLDVGDVQVISPESETITIERKTFADLRASIVDGRLHEQYARSECVQKYVYLLEIDAPKGGFWSVSAEDDALTKAMRTHVLRAVMSRGIPVIFASSPSDSAAFLVHMMMSKPEACFSVPTLTSESQYETYVAKQCSLRKSKRGANIDARLCAVMQLCQVPGVSAKLAAGILDHYEARSMKSLVQRFLAFDGTRELCADLQRVSKVGKEIARKVCVFFGFEFQDSDILSTRSGRMP